MPDCRLGRIDRLYIALHLNKAATRYYEDCYFPSKARDDLEQTDNVKKRTMLTS